MASQEGSANLAAIIIPKPESGSRLLSTSLSRVARRQRRCERQPALHAVVHEHTDAPQIQGLAVLRADPPLRVRDGGNLGGVVVQRPEHAVEPQLID